MGPLEMGSVSAHRYAGWVSDNYKGKYQVTDGVLKMQGDSRAYLVQDYRHNKWAEHKYVRLDLHKYPLRYTVDLSHVPCGCLACVYMQVPRSIEPRLLRALTSGHCLTSCYNSPFT